MPVNGLRSVPAYAGCRDINPLEVDLLWGLAGRGQTGADVSALGQLICAGLAADPGQMSHPSDAEILSYRKVDPSTTPMN